MPQSSTCILVTIHNDYNNKHIPQFSKCILVAYTRKNLRCWFIRNILKSQLKYIILMLKCLI